MVQKVLVLSDLHLTTDGQKIIGLDPEARLQAVLDAALSEHPDAAALVLLGDLAHDADPRAYARLAEMLANVPCPVIPMLGNHDHHAGFAAGFPDEPLDKQGHLQRILDVGQHRIITLDTRDTRPDAPFRHAGWLCDARLAWLDAALDEADGRNLLVFAHHPPFDIGFPGMDGIRLLNGDALLDRLVGHTDLHLLCGHVHRSISGQTRGVPWTIFKSPCHQCPVDLISADSSISINEPGGYGLLLLQPDGVIVHHIDVGTGATATHDPGSVTAG